MCEIPAANLGPPPNPLTTSRNCARPRPRRCAMLELTRRSGQANADRQSYDFSLGKADCYIFSGH
jgi:hypothetical protein